MPTGRRVTQPDAQARLSIGALSRATGVPTETLRTWEQRYGFPVPERRPSGHRLYPLSAVPRLRRIAEALGRGHRAGQVVSASERELSAMLAATATTRDRVPGPPLPPAGSVEDLLALVEAFDGGRLTAALLANWARATPLEFLEACVAPLARAVGEAWARDRLQVRHEHFLSERLADVLRALRMPFEGRAHGPLVVLASLPGEPHALGLQMAALVLSSCGLRVLYLGPETPPAELVQLARDTSARAVAVSVSAATSGAPSASALRALRAALPKRTALLAGGDGAPPARRGLEVFRDLAALDAWARASLRAARPGGEPVV